MTPEFADCDLDAEVVFDRTLDEHDLGRLQHLLGSLAPRWASKLRVWRGPRDQRPVEVGRPGALASAVLDAVAERGATYRQLVEKHGRPPHERIAGSAELRGAGPELVVIVSLDQLVLSPLGARKQLGNGVAVQVRRPTVERRPGTEWLSSAFTSLTELSPAWGYAAHAGEYWAKVMSDPPRIEAAGRDFGRFLPGLFWLNFFGRRYRELIGADRFTSLPAGLASLGDDPLAWDTPEYAILEQRLRDHLGPSLFYSKADPTRHTVAPDFDT
jgi:hypothetical protein